MSTKIIIFPRKSQNPPLNCRTNQTLFFPISSYIYDPTFSRPINISTTNKQDFGHTHNSEHRNCRVWSNTGQTKNRSGFNIWYPPILKEKKKKKSY